MDDNLSNLTNPVKGFGFDGGIIFPSFEQSNLDFQFDRTLRGTTVSGIGFPILDQPSDVCRYAPFYNVSSEVDFPEDQESYPLLNYINQLLMEEDLEDQPSIWHDPLALQAAEKSFYEVIGKNYPTSSPCESLGALENIEQISYCSTGNSPHNGESSSDTSGYTFETTSSIESSLQTNSPQFLPRVDNSCITGEGLMDCLSSGNLVSSFLSDSDTLLQFKKGLEEGSKFLPRGKQLIINLDQYKLPSKEPETTELVSMVKKDEEKHSSSGFRGRKQPYRDCSDLDTGRCNKQSAFDSDEVELAETFDRLLRDAEAKGKVLCSEIDFQHPTRSSKNFLQNGALQGVRKNSKKKHGSNNEALDLNALLISCAQFVAAGDHKSANERLKLIRQHACHSGRADQRLAIPFANALEARLVGNVPDYFDNMNSKLTSAAEELKAQRVYLCAPFRQIHAFFSNKMIMQAASKATALHIVDFGIGYGFQWPSFIQRLSERAGGPPKLRITGIGIPQPGLRPAERIEQTGRRLAKYCERFQVPFEYRAVVIRNWQRIRIDELKLAKNEFLAVNCQFRFQNLLDDQTVGDKDPKDTILSLIREMKPDILVTDIVNGQFGGPFFLNRFREALFFFTSAFDLLEKNLPREDKYRIKYEQGYLGAEVMNVVACEGLARVERPETYKQWEMRYKRAGFRLLPLDQDLIEELKSKVEEGYHNEFNFDVDGNWVVQAWKGRAFTACCCCIPV